MHPRIYTFIQLVIEEKRMERKASHRRCCCSTRQKTQDCTSASAQPKYLTQPSVWPQLKHIIAIFSMVPHNAVPLSPTDTPESCIKKEKIRTLPSSPQEIPQSQYCRLQLVCFYLLIYPLSCYTSRVLSDCVPSQDNIILSKVADNCETC